MPDRSFIFLGGNTRFASELTRELEGQTYDGVRPAASQSIDR